MLRGNFPEGRKKRQRGRGGGGSRGETLKGQRALLLFLLLPSSSAMLSFLLLFLLLPSSSAILSCPHKEPPYPGEGRLRRFLHRLLIILRLWEGGRAGGGGGRGAGGHVCSAVSSSSPLFAALSCEDSTLKYSAPLRLPPVFCPGGSSWTSLVQSPPPTPRLPNQSLQMGG